MKEYEEYIGALALLRQAPEEDLDDEFVQQGLIVKFALQYELGCKLLKTMLVRQENAATVVRTKRGMVKSTWWYYDFVDGDIWLSMSHDAEDKEHVTNADTASRIVKSIVEEYLPEFVRVQEGLEARYGELLLE